jgi:sulfatase modifying factor 1
VTSTRRSASRSHTLAVVLAAGLACSGLVDAAAETMPARDEPPAGDRQPLTVAMVTVGDVGNAADPSTGRGRVDYAYRIATLDVTIAEYVAFLNAVAKRDPHRLYDERMASDLLVAGIRRSGKPGRYVYDVIGPSGPVQSAAASPGNRPITYVSWYDAARFANWMANGQPAGRQNKRTTEDGAYKLRGRRVKRGMAVARNAINPNTGKAPAFYIPTEDEWYKAAYYDPGLDDGAGGYTLYATQSDTAPGNVAGDGSNLANYTSQGLFALTQVLSLDLSQSYLTDVGAFRRSVGPHGTFDQNGGVWEWTDMDGSRSPIRILRGGGWTSFHTYLQSTYRLGNVTETASSNAGFRLASSVPPSPSDAYALVEVGHPGNRADRTGFGRVDQTFWIGTYEVTIGQYVEFLNAVAATDPHGLYDQQMALVANSAGIQRSGTSGAYVYAPIDNFGDSLARPITYVSWFDAARFANWMANGRPRGSQSSATTEDGAYPLDGATTGEAVPLRSINPNTGAAPTFSIPTEDQWYKAAYFSPSLRRGRGGYYLYATSSDEAPGNRIGDGTNDANYIDDYSGTFFYSVTQSRQIDLGQNYLLDVGTFAGTRSHYGLFDQAGAVYQWNDLDGATGPARGIRGGFWFAGSISIQSLNFAQVAPDREENDTGIRLAGPAS